MGLLVCQGCARHRRSSDSECPFCGARTTVAETPRPVVSGATRAALVFGGVALGASVGCFSKGDVYGAPPPPDAGSKVESPVPVYGGPAMYTLPDGGRTLEPPTPPTPPTPTPSASTPAGPPKPSPSTKSR